jgi:hypothetical protein
VGKVDGVERDTEGFEHRPVGIAERGGERNETPLRPRQPLPEAAVVVPMAGEADPFT